MNMSGSTTNRVSSTINVIDDDDDDELLLDVRGGRPRLQPSKMGDECGVAVLRLSLLNEVSIVDDGWAVFMGTTAPPLVFELDVMNDEDPFEFDVAMVGCVVVVVVVKSSL